VKAQKRSPNVERTIQFFRELADICEARGLHDTAARHREEADRISKDGGITWSEESADENR
jgi:hypothetical protein